MARTRLPFKPPKRPERILAIDTGLTTGWAFVARRGPIRSGDHDFMPYAGETGRVLAVFENWLADQITEFAPELVIYEAPVRFGRGWLLRAGFACAVEKAAYVHELFVKDVSPTVIKIHATGRGKASKGEMIEAAVKAGYQPTSDHEADALHLLDYARVHLREAA